MQTDSAAVTLSRTSALHMQTDSAAAAVTLSRLFLPAPAASYKSALQKNKTRILCPGVFSGVWRRSGCYIRSTSSELTLTSLFSGDVGRRFHSTRLHGITYCDVIVVFHKLCRAACQDVACTVCNPQVHCRPAETGHTVALSATSSPPLHPHFVTVTTKLAAQSSRFCVSLLPGLFFISVIISYFLFATFPFFFVSLCLSHSLQLPSSTYLFLFLHFFILLSFCLFLSSFIYVSLPFLLSIFILFLTFFVFIFAVPFPLYSFFAFCCFPV